MSIQRNVEVFTAGCPVCQNTVELVKRLACPSCKISVLDIKDKLVAERATALGIRSLPTVVIDGRLASCCQNSGAEESALRSAGLGRAFA